MLIFFYKIIINYNSILVHLLGGIFFFHKIKNKTYLRDINM